MDGTTTSIVASINLTESTDMKEDIDYIIYCAGISAKLIPAVFNEALHVGRENWIAIPLEYAPGSVAAL